MAIEAATQAVEVNGKEQNNIQNYHLRNVSIQNALMVPEDDHGVETLFTMHPAALNNIARHETRLEFLLTSVANRSGENEFVEHCRGTIEVMLDYESLFLATQWTVR